MVNKYNQEKLFEATSNKVLNTLVTLGTKLKQTNEHTGEMKTTIRDLEIIAKRVIFHKKQEIRKLEVMKKSKNKTARIKKKTITTETSTPYPLVTTNQLTTNQLTTNQLTTTQVKTNDPTSFNIIFTSILEEINCNASLEVPNVMKHRIAYTICKMWAKKKIPIEQAKKFMYEKYKINISYQTDRQLNVSTEETKHNDVEYNELLGKYVYGWDLNGDAVYEPTIGIRIMAPEYVNAGNEWRQVLDHRYSKIDPCDRECELFHYTGN
jgi:hypothetical protein